MARNIIANYFGLAFLALVDLGMVPVQLRFMGVEAYGLIGFYLMLLNWLHLLDFGLRGTLVRETASFHGGAIRSDAFADLVSPIFRIFNVTAFFILIALALGSRIIADSWLQSGQLPSEQVAWSIALMGSIFSLQWMSAPYRSLIVGMERQVWLNSYLAALASARSIGTVVGFMFVGAGPVHFFAYQAVFALLEYAGLRLAVRYWLPDLHDRSVPHSFKALQRISGFASSLAFGSVVWIFLTQSDKLILSKLLPLGQYAAFSLAVTAAGGILLLQAPFVQALQPRFTKLVSRGDGPALLEEYLNVSQLLCGVSIAIAAVLALHAKAVLAAWTGDASIAQEGAGVLSLYAMGNACLAPISLTYLLQFANGDLRLHWRGNVIFALVLVPGVVAGTLRWGMMGAGIVWCAVNVATLLLWTPVIHRRFMKGRHWKWLLGDVLGPGAVGCVPGLLGLYLPWERWQRWETITALVTLGLLSSAVALLASRAGVKFVRLNVLRRAQPT